MKMNERSRKRFILFLVALLPFIGSCGKGPEKSEQTLPRRRVAVIPIKKENIEDVLCLTGTIAAIREVKITSKIPGRVEKVFVEESSPVKAGESLIHLETVEIALSVKRAEAALAVAEANLADVKSDHSRMRILFEEESIPKQKWEKAQLGLKVAASQLEQAMAALALAKEQLNNAVIRSPIDGVVAHRNVEPGEVVSPPMIPGRPLIHVVDTSNLKTRVSISENRVKQVRLEQDAVITVEGLPGETFPGRVSKISPVVDPQSRTFGVEILFPNSDKRLKPGMFARTKLILASRTEVVKVPLEAVIEQEKSHLVFLDVDGVARARLVTLGICDGIDVEITSGVAPGDRVIVQGNIGLEDGARILPNALETAKEQIPGG